MLIQRWLNADPALELLAITASAPDQRLAFTHPSLTLSTQVYWNDWKSNSVHVDYKFNNPEKFTRCSFNVNPVHCDIYFHYIAKVK